MKKLLLIHTILLLGILSAQAQNDSLYILKKGFVQGKYRTADLDSLRFFSVGNSNNDSLYLIKGGVRIAAYKLADIDSIVFYKPQELPSITDIDGNRYHIITIGTQTWMAENLKTTKYNDGTGISLITDNTTWSSLTTPGRSYYNNDSASYKATYGTLYNWYSVSYSTNGNKNVCPISWHVPTDAEWTSLESYLADNGYNYDGTTTTTNVRDKIAKALSDSIGWNSSTTTAAVGNTDYTVYRNKSGFTGLPGGFRSDNGTFYFVGDYCLWWTVTEENPNCGWYRDMTYNNPLVDRSYGFKKNAFSVRCVKD